MRLLLSLAALFGPWLVGPALRHAHAPLVALGALGLAAATMLLRGPRREPTVLLLLLACIWPPALVELVGGALDLGRPGLIVSAALLVGLAVSVRLLAVRRTTPPEQRRFAELLDRAFPDLMPVARAEIGLFWFGLFRWRRNAADAPAEAIRFPGTATGTEVAMCLLTAAGFVIETPLMHLLLAHLCSETLAWLCTGLHVVFGVYLVGYAKSLLFRPTLLFADRLQIRLGVVAGQVVPRAAIATIEAVAASEGWGEGSARPPGDRRLYGLDAPNLRLTTQAGAAMLFRVDDPRGLLRAIAA